MNVHKPSTLAAMSGAVLPLSRTSIRGSVAHRGVGALLTRSRPHAIMDLDFFTRVCLRARRVSAEVMHALNEQVRAELLAPSIAARAAVAVDLDKPETWPSGEARRVVEVTPREVAIEAIGHFSSPCGGARCHPGQGRVGTAGEWRAPEGGADIDVRHWYAITFPSEPAPGDASSAWTPINRRGVLWRGFHVDIGPGFDTDELPLAGHPYQGV